MRTVFDPPVSLKARVSCNGAWHVGALGALLFLAACGAAHPRNAAHSGPPATTCAPSRGAPRVRGHRLVRTMTHPAGHFTQGLAIAPDHTLWESVGRYGRSRVFELDLQTGAVLRTFRRPDSEFAEGLVATDDALLLLTWCDERAWLLSRNGSVRWTMAFRGEGWGLARVGSARELVMSNGTAVLQFFDRLEVSATPHRTLTVCASGAPLRGLNELESDGTWIFANVYPTSQPQAVSVNSIAQIDARTGEVVATIDLSPYAAAEHARGDHETNGIAFDPTTQHLFVTGKDWNHVYEIELAD